MIEGWLVYVAHGLRPSSCSLSDKLFWGVIFSGKYANANAADDIENIYTCTRDFRVVQ